MDKYVLRKLEIERGARIRAEDIFTIVNSKLNNSIDIESLCGTCEWKEKCLCRLFMRNRRYINLEIRLREKQGYMRQRFGKAINNLITCSLTKANYFPRALRQWL